MVPRTFRKGEKEMIQKEISAKIAEKENNNNNNHKAKNKTSDKYYASKKTYFIEIH